MGTRKVSGRLWFRTEGSGVNCPYFCRTKWEPVEFEVDEKYVLEQPREDQMSILTDAGETFEPLDLDEGLTDTLE